MAKLGDYINIKHGYAFKGDFIVAEDNNVVLVTPGNFAIGGGFKENKCKFYTGEYPQDYILNAEDLIVTMTDLSKDGDTLGYSALVPYSNRIYLHNQRIGLVELKRKDVLKDYIYWFMRTKKYHQQILATSSGSTVKHTSPSRICEIEIEVPLMDIQEKIVSLLNSIDKKITQNLKINDNLEQQAQTLFQKLFVENTNPNWHCGTINDLGLVIGGSTPSKSRPDFYTDNGIAWITPKDLSVNKSKFISHGENDITELGLKNSSASIMPAGTVLFSSRAPIGYIAIAKNEVTTNQGFKSIVPKSEVGTAFVYFFLKNNLSIIENMASGSTFKEVSGNTMKSVPAVVPDIETLKFFNDFCSSLFELQETLEEENRTLEITRDTLLPKLMSGKLDISDFEI